MQALITRKVGMTSTINDDGVAQAVTLLSTSSCTITQVKTEETDGYNAIQVGCEEKPNQSKPLAGHYKKAKVSPKVAYEFRISELSDDMKVGETISADSFNVGDIVDATGTSKGKGFAGVIKRHNFKSQRKSHGAKGHTRAPGSIGSMYPQKIFKGKRMSGQMGNVRVTVKNLKVALVDSDLGVIGITGAIPGPRRSVVILKGKK